MQVVKVSPAAAGGVSGVCHSHGAHQPLDRCTMLSAPTAVKMLLLSYRNLIMQSNDIEQNTPISTVLEPKFQCNPTHQPLDRCAMQSAPTAVARKRKHEILVLHNFSSLTGKY